jgi:hypothetical protein
VKKKPKDEWVIAQSMALWFAHSVTLSQFFCTSLNVFNSLNHLTDQ